MTDEAGHGMHQRYARLHSILRYSILFYYILLYSVLRTQLLCCYYYCGIYGACIWYNISLSVTVLTYGHVYSISSFSSHHLGTSSIVSNVIERVIPTEGNGEYYISIAILCFFQIKFVHSLMTILKSLQSLLLNSIDDIVDSSPVQRYSAYGISFCLFIITR